MKSRSEYIAEGRAGQPGAVSEPGALDLSHGGQGGPCQRKALTADAGVLAQRKIGQHLAEHGPELEGVTRTAGTDDNRSLAIEHEVLVGGHRVQARLRPEPGRLQPGKARARILRGLVVLYRVDLVEGSLGGIDGRSRNV